MIRRVTVLALAVLAFAGAAGAQQIAPRDIWPQAAAAARDGDLDAADKRTAELLGTGRTYGIRTFPLYAAAAAGLASENATANPALAQWAIKTAHDLDPRSPAVAYSEADRAARKNDWPGAIQSAIQGYARSAGNYRHRTLATSDVLIVGSVALAITAVVFAIALFIRYGRSLAHDFREMLGLRLTGGSVSVLAFALLFLPLFVWFGPMWLVFYWFAIFFGYAGTGERIAIAVLMLLTAVMPVAMGAAASSVAKVDSPVVAAALSGSTQSYQPEALRRLQELINVVPDDPVLHVLLGNMQAFEGMDDQAGVHFRRAVELRPGYAGAHVNLGNLLFLNNEFQAAITEYEKAEQADPKIAIAFYNHSVAAGETYKFDLQARMLEKARDADRGLVERIRRNAPPQKIVVYTPAVDEAWAVTEKLASRPAARALFANYSTFDPASAAANPVTLGALLALILGAALWSWRRRSGFANSCIKCGRTFCFRCKSARESTTYCTQCIHIYLKRDGVSLDTKRKKLDEVSGHLAGMVRRNRIFATFLPGSAQMLEGNAGRGIAALFFFALFASVAVFVGHLAPAFGPVAHVAQLALRIVAVVLAVILWLTTTIPVYRRRVAG